MSLRHAGLGINACIPRVFISGLRNAGLLNTGLRNVGLRNAGLCNAGLCNAGLRNAGSRYAVWACFLFGIGQFC